jgi:hypothetical protein
MSTKRVRKIIGINLQQKKKMGPGLEISVFPPPIDIS